MKKLLFLALATISFGCSSVKSDFSYQKGKDCFWNGRYDEALAHLHKAVELDPTSSRNHTQLAMTYERAGNLPRAWEHAHRAYLLDSQSRPAFETFSRIFRTLSSQHHLDSPRKQTAIVIVEVLGVADKYLHDEKGALKALYYGPVCLHFEQGLLTATEWLGY